MLSILSLKRANGKARAVRLGKEGLAILGGQIGAVLGGIVGIRIVTEVAPPHVYGEAALVLGLVNLAMGLTATPFMHYTARAYSDVILEGRYRPFRAFALRRLIVLCLGGAVILALGGVILDLSTGELRLGLWALAGGVLVGMSLSAFENAILTVARRQAARSIWQCAQSIGFPVFAAVAMLLFGPSSTSYLFGRALFPALAVFLFWSLTSASFPYQGPRVAKADAAVWSRQALKYALPLIPLAIVAWAIQMADRYILANYRTLAEVGLYSAAAGLARQPFLVAGATFSRLFKPIMFAASARGDERRRRRALWYYILLITLICAAGFGLFVFMGRSIVRVLLASEYREGALPLLPWIAAAGGFLAMSGTFEVQMFTDKATWRITVAYGIAAVVNVGLNLLLIPGMGTKGAAIAMCTSYALYFAVGMLFMFSTGRLVGRHGAKW